MNEENDTGKHEFNFFLDKQIQEKLLEADELIAAKETASSNQLSTANSSNSAVISNSPSVSKSSPPKPAKDSLRGNISGWCSGPGVVFRKTESDVPTRSRTQQSIRDALSQNSRFRPQTYNPQDFVFRHYSDSRKYIEQYRKEHTCYDTTTTSATRSEFLDTRRFYAYNQYSPLAVGSQNNTNSIPSSNQEPAATIPDQTFFNQKKQQQQQQAPTLQYTNRREQTKQTISASLRPSNLYKLSKSNTTGLEKAKTPDHLQEERNGHSDQHRDRTGSAMGSGSPGLNGITLQKTLTTADIERLSSRSQKTALGVTLESNGSGQFLGRKLGQVTSGQTRTSDALASHTPLGGKQISGDPQIVVSAAAPAWPCPEVRLEHFRRGPGWRGSGRVVVQPTVTAPQLTLITEGDEGRSSWAPISANSMGDDRSFPEAKVSGGRMDAAGVDDQETHVADAGSCSDGAGGSRDGGHSHPSSLQPTDGSSVRTSLSSQTSGSNPTHSKKLKKLSRPRSEEGAKVFVTFKKDVGDLGLAKPAASASSIPAALQETAAPSWRDRVQKQHKSVTSSGDAPSGDILLPAVTRWAVARRQEELSSVAHARRIRQLIEQSRQKGSGAGLTLGRSVSDGSGREAKQDRDLLRVEGLHQAQQQPFHSPFATSSTVGPSSKDPNHVEGIWTDLELSPHRVLPPVRKSKVDNDTNGSKSKQHQASERPFLGDLLETQTFFSHGISLGSTDVANKKHNINHSHQYHPQQPLPLQHGLPRQASLSRTLNPPVAASRITLATAAVIGEPPQPRLKYTAAFQQKLTGSCLP